MLEDSWRDLICSYSSQHDLAKIACLNKGTTSTLSLPCDANIPAWNIAATKALYASPDLSRCNEAQLLAFLASVQSSKSRRRRVLVLDLLQPKAPRESQPFFESDFCQVSAEHKHRYDADIFAQLFAAFKNLSVARIYGHSLHDRIKAHWSALGQSLTELRIHNIGTLSDTGLIRIATSLAQTLQILHIEHPRMPERSLRVGTIAGIVKILPNLKHLGVGLPIENIRNDKNFLEGLCDLESLTFVRVPDLDFTQLAPDTEVRWKYLTVRHCPGMRPEDLDAVLRRLPLLISLDWRFPEDTYYEWEEYEIRTAACRRLQCLVLENAFLSDQCLLRLFRVTSRLDVLALSNCENIHRLRCKSGILE